MQHLNCPLPDMVRTLQLALKYIHTDYCSSYHKQAKTHLASPTLISPCIANFAVIRKTNPKHTKVSLERRDGICEMCLMFLHYISDEKIKTTKDQVTIEHSSFKFCIVEQYQC